jgi:hypothetical protein
MTTATDAPRKREVDLILVFKSQNGFEAIAGKGVEILKNPAPETLYHFRSGGSINLSSKITIAECSANGRYKSGHVVDRVAAAGIFPSHVSKEEAVALTSKAFNP